MDAESGVSYQIDFIGTHKGFDDSSAAAVDDEDKAAGLTRVNSEEVGAVLQSTTGESATYRLTGKELYVRARVTSSRKHPNPSEAGEYEKAWIQPIVP